MSTAAQSEIISTAPLSPGNAAAENSTHGCKHSTTLENQREMVWKHLIEKKEKSYFHYF